MKATQYRDQCGLAVRHNASETLEHWHKVSDRLEQTFITLWTKRLTNSTADKYLAIIYNNNSQQYATITCNIVATIDVWTFNI